MSGTMKVGGKTLATHDTNTNVAKIQLGSASDVVLTDSAGNNVLSESSGVVTLTADAAVLEGSSSGDLVRITQTGSGNALVVEDSANPDSTPFVVDASGNVGVGTSSPSADLHIQSAITGTQHYDQYAHAIIEGVEARLQIVANDSGTNAAGILVSNETKHWGIHHTGPFDGNALEFGNYTSTTTGEDIFNLMTPRMRIESSGIVHITSVSGIDFSIGSSDRWGINSGVNFIISNSNDSGSTYTERMRIDPSGNLKINNLGSGDVYATSGTLYISSDIRLKNDLGVIDESGIEIIKQLTPRYYSWKEDENNRKQLGFFAQEVFPILPEAVPRDLKYEQNGVDENGEPILEQVLDENGEPDYQWGFATQPIVAMLVKAIQEQQTLIESQQSQIDALTARISALETT